MDQNVARPTVRHVYRQQLPVMNATANQSGASILTSGWATTTLVLKQGDIISISGVNGVNPIFVPRFSGL